MPTQNNRLAEDIYFIDDLDNQTEIKNQFSTFIDELEEETEKLMEEVFNAQYTPEIGNQQPKSKYMASNRVSTHIHNPESTFYSSKYGLNSPTKVYEIRHKSNSEFQEFLDRNRKWEERKQRNIEIERRKKLEREQSKITSHPQILELSKKLVCNEPLYLRASHIHESKEKVRTLKRVQQQHRQEKQFTQLSFHPYTKNNAKYKSPRTLQQYLQHKSEWENNKLEARKHKKIMNEAKKYEECSFTPCLVSKKMMKSHTLKTEKVEDRLLRSLEKVTKGSD